VERDEIASLLETDAEDLWLLVGRELAGQGALPPDERSLRVLAKKWLGQRRQALREALCGNETIRQLASAQQATSQRVDLVVAICDLVSSVAVGVAPWTVSALLCKEGLRNLCEEEWNCDTARSAKS
jgi:hypothetical protein